MKSWRIVIVLLVGGTIGCWLAFGAKGAEPDEDNEPFVFAGKQFESQKEFATSGRICGARAPSNVERSLIHERLRRFSMRNAGFASRPLEIVVPVYFHVIHDGDEGKVTEARLDEQLSVLNAAYGQHGITFEKEDILYADKPEWFHMSPDSAEERQAKTALGADPKRNLNFYTAELVPDGLLGWGTFPYDLAGDPVLDGVVVLHRTLPGGDPPYDEGKTGVHEVGHWLGLFHTFEGTPDGCQDPNGDYVDDTPAQLGPEWGREPETRDSCPAKPGRDPVHNYMNYTDDSWRTEITVGQIERIRLQIGSYRPFLLHPATRSTVASP